MINGISNSNKTKISYIKNNIENNYLIRNNRNNIFFNKKNFSYKEFY